MCFGLVYQVHLIGVGFNGFGVCLPIPGEMIQSLMVAYYVFHLGCKHLYTKNDHILKQSTFFKPSFWVSMLVFGDVVMVLRSIC